MGKTYIHEDLTVPSIYAGYCIRFRFDEEKVNPFFVYWWTKTSAYWRWVATIQRPAGQPNINKEEFKSCPIPLPDLSTQIEMVSQMLNFRGTIRELFKDADQLLVELNNFIFATLDITAPVHDKRKVYAITIADLSDNWRLNAEYYHPERILAIRSLKETSKFQRIEPLFNLVSFIRDQIREPNGKYLGLANVAADTGLLIDSEEEVNGLCFTFMENDILFGRLRPYLNKVYKAEMDGCCSPEFHVLRVKNVKELLPDYLAAILRSRLVLSQTVHMMSGNTHPRLANEDVINLNIPVPDISIQRIIANEVSRRRVEAIRLKVEAEETWNDAILWFESKLLNVTVNDL